MKKMTEIKYKFWRDYTNYKKIYKDCYWDIFKVKLKWDIRT